MLSAGFDSNAVSLHASLHCLRTCCDDSAMVSACWFSLPPVERASVGGCASFSVRAVVIAHVSSCTSVLVARLSAVSCF